MSEKRFEISKDKYFIFDNTEDDFLDLEDVVNKLNALAEEIEELKLENKKLKEENEWLKQQLLYDGDDVCGICKHEYLTPSGNYFIAKCEKGHEECSKENIKYCEDFKLKELEDE